MVLVANLPNQPIDPLDDIVRRLAARTAIRPDIPRALPFLRALFLDLRGRNALVVAVVPLADVAGDGDLGVGALGRGLRVLDLPRVGVVAAEVEELDGLLCARAGRDVAGWALVLCVVEDMGASVRRCEVSYMWTSCLGTIRRSSPTSARPVARTRFSPLAVRGMSEVPVWRPSSDHSVSPWRTMKHRGVVIPFLRDCTGTRRSMGRELHLGVGLQGVTSH